MRPLIARSLFKGMPLMRRLYVAATVRLNSLLASIGGG
jgi:hypothetical protein